MNQHQIPWITALLAGFALALTSTPVRGGEAVLPICEPPVDGSPVLKEAGGFAVTQAEWDAELLSIPSRARSRYETDKAKQDLTDRVLLNKALFAEARKAGVVDDPVVQRAARMAAEKSFIQAFFSELEKGAATDEKIKAYYEENIKRYSRPMVRLSHILVKEESEALSLKKQIDGGADFAALAEEHSLDRGSKAKGGEMNWATKDRYVPPFADVAFELQVGEVSAPVKTRFGHHVIKVHERRDVQPLAEVRSGIERVLVRDAVRDFRNGVKEDLGIGKAARSAPSVARTRTPGAPGTGVVPGAPSAADGGPAVRVRQGRGTADAGAKGSDAKAGAKSSSPADSGITIERKAKKKAKTK